MLCFMGSQRVGHDWVTELNWSYISTDVMIMITKNKYDHLLLNSLMVNWVHARKSLAECHAHGSCITNGSCHYNHCSCHHNNHHHYSVHGIFQARILERVAISFSRGSSWPGDGTCISFFSCKAGGFFTIAPWEAPSLWRKVCYWLGRSWDWFCKSTWVPLLIWPV